ncbi:MAG TPA: pyruvate kinase [Anaerolineaceae bacterium]|jgi:pyruvate kinase|nr:pyruvate kinase [Anaerolineaceae bacterium]NMD27670.1 pyruvate kinase [Chloroflexota bacterium]HOA20883.1 pyruvate kinase [Anaerolineaceae bacterium]HOG76654.1 pyruvate kinase [Anaerolineaceae bacterium]
MNRFAKIVATLGPSSSDEATLRELISAGMDVARLNFSHGTHDDHAQKVKLLRKLSDELGKPISILMDLQGPKLRIGKLEKDFIELKSNQVVALSSSENPENVREGTIFIPFDVPKLHEALVPGNHILMDDGQLEFEVTELDGENIYAKVILGGNLKSHKGVNLPGSKLDIPCLTPKDLEDLQFGLDIGVDLVAISFVKQASDILTVRDTMRSMTKMRHLPPIVAKLERPEAVANLESIIDATDGVMVARGDLGVEMSPAVVPSAQKAIIRAANHKGKFVITATQMLESMINNPRPTRAEAADVANAIFDGTDAVMLSAESAAGKYPVQSVRMMEAIIRESEQHLSEWGHMDSVVSSDQLDEAISIARAAKDLTADARVSAIVVFTISGASAMWMSKTKPSVPIYAFTPEMRTYQWLGIAWGVTPLLVPHADTLETMIKHVETAITSSTPLCAGDQVVVISGFPVGDFGKPNLTLLYTLRG